MKTRYIVLVVVACVVAMLSVIAVTLLVVDRQTGAVSGTPGVTKEEVVVSQIHNKFPETTNWPEGTIVNIAKDTCASLDRGESFDNVIYSVMTKHMTVAEQSPDATAAAMVAGIKELCPQHSDKARMFANGG
jgi:hypothetical protein